MPYIQKTRAQLLEDGIQIALLPGDLNYMISNIVADYLRDVGLCYETLNDVVGALECAKQEFLRRVVIPYEDMKQQEQGRVDPYALVQ